MRFVPTSTSTFVFGLQSCHLGDHCLTRRKAGGYINLHKVFIGGACHGMKIDQSIPIVSLGGNLVGKLRVRAAVLPGVRLLLSTA